MFVYAYIYISTNLFLWINVFESYIYCNINVYVIFKTF